MGTPKNLMFEKIPFFFLVSKLSHPTTLCPEKSPHSIQSYVLMLRYYGKKVLLLVSSMPPTHTYVHTYTNIFKGIHSKFQGFGDGDWKTTTTQNAKKEHFQVCHSSLFYFTDRPTKRIDVKSRELYSSWEICSINTKVCMLTFFLPSQTHRQTVNKDFSHTQINLVCKVTSTMWCGAWELNNSHIMTTLYRALHWFNVSMNPSQKMNELII